MAMGRALQGMAGENPDIAYTSGVIVLALIMVVYGTLGGLRARGLDGRGTGNRVVHRFYIVDSVITHYVRSPVSCHKQHIELARCQ